VHSSTNIKDILANKIKVSTEYTFGQNMKSSMSFETKKQFIKTNCCTAQEFLLNVSAGALNITIPDYPVTIAIIIVALLKADIYTKSQYIVIRANTDKTPRSRNKKDTYKYWYDSTTVFKTTLSIHNVKIFRKT
jgi:hypothetical protein